MPNETLSNDSVLLTESDAAKKATVKPETLRKWRTRGRGPVYIKIGGKVRYQMSDLLEFIQSGRVVPKESKRAGKKRGRLALPPSKQKTLSAARR
jgi:Helix-turn-helix domain